jgi:mono/diheme cytochrome c family protein
VSGVLALAPVEAFELERRVLHVEVGGEAAAELIEDAAGIAIGAEHDVGGDDVEPVVRTCRGERDTEPIVTILRSGPGSARALILAGGILAVLLGSCSAGAALPAATGPAGVGQRIYDAGIGPDGTPIARSGGLGMMTGAGCASCHGRNGHGGATMMFNAPNITYANLTNPAGMVEVDGTHGMVYTDALIRRAVVDGIGADGDTLDSTMPRWQLSDAEWQDLLAYLKTLP